MKRYLLCLLVCVACSKEKYNFKQVFAPAFKDQKEMEVTKSAATLSITLVQDYNSMVSKRGFYYATSKEALANIRERRVATDPSFGTGSYTVQLKHLIPETTYYYQAFATNGQGTALAEIQSFTTLKGTAAIVSTLEPEVKDYQITFKGTILDTGGYPITEYGFYYSTVNQQPSAADGVVSKTTPSYRNETFTLPLQTFVANTSYYVRAYVVTQKGKALGEVLKFNTSREVPALGVEIETPTNITNTSALVKAKVAHIGGAATYQTGFVYSSTQEMPSLENGATKVLGVNTTERKFFHELTGLAPAKRYFLRAFVTNAAGTVYSEQLLLHTLPTEAPEGVHFVIYKDLQQRSVSLYGSVASAADGGVITERGFVYDTSSGRLTQETAQVVRLQGGAGNFSTTIQGLTPLTQYYVRAYAKNQFGVAYSEEVATFTTEDMGTPSALQIIYAIPSVSEISLSALVREDGGGSISRRGFVYSKEKPQPTLDDSWVEVGNGAGNFSATLRRLSVDTRYYVRAFATNERGTSYSEPLALHTQNVSLPTLASFAQGEVFSTRVKLTGNITSNGGGKILQYGFVYSQHHTTPTLENNTGQVSLGENILGHFSMELTQLQRNKTYYVRAFATNERGTTYSDPQSLTTPILSVGDTHEGGIVAYLFTPMDEGFVAGQLHGYLIPNTTDLPTEGYVWGCALPQNSTSPSLGTGRDNTTLIANDCSDTSASYYVRHHFRAANKDDWFIPSMVELSNIAHNRNLLRLPVAAYWSSTQKDYYEAYYVLFAPTDAKVHVAEKNNPKKILPIREF